MTGIGFSFDPYDISSLTRGFRNHSKDNISYNSCISACECAAQKDLAVQLVAEMRDVSLDADLVTFNASISSCESLGFGDGACGLPVQLDINHVSPVYPAIIFTLTILDQLNLSKSRVRQKTNVCEGNPRFCCCAFSAFS